MAAVTLIRNTKIQLDGNRYRLTRLLEDSIWQIEEERTGRIKEVSHRELLSRYARRELIFIAPHQGERTSGRKSRPLGTFVTPEQLKEATRRKTYVDATLGLTFTRGEAITCALVKAHEKVASSKKCPSFASVARWRRAYLARGRDIAALMPRPDLRGRKNKELLPEVEKIMEEVVDEIFLTLERGTIQDVRDEIEVRIDRENATRAKSEHLEVPSIWQLQKYIYSIPAYDRCLCRHGYTVARAKFRAVLGKNRIDVPLDHAQMDHTRLDLMVVDDEYALPLGRPWLTICMDCATRCVLGIHISFEPPSYHSVAQCLRHAFMPKVELQSEYPDLQNKWDSHGVMSHLIVDNGLEFHSTALEQCCLGSGGIEIHYAPRKVAWFKGKVERLQGSLNRGTSHKVPGTTFSNIFEKGEYDPKKHAIISMSALKHIIHTWIVDYYHQRPHRGINKQAPIQVWRNAIKPDQIRYPEDPTQLDVLIGRPYDRVLSHTGVEVSSELFYNSEELRAWRKQEGDKFDVTVLVDEGDLGHVIVTDRKTHTYRVPCTDLAYAAGMSLWQHKVCRRYAAEHLDTSGPKAWLHAKSKIRDLIANEMGKASAKRKTHAKVARFGSGAASPALASASPVAEPVDASAEPPTPPTPPPSLPETAAASPTPKARDLRASESERDSATATAPEKKFVAIVRAAIPRKSDLMR